MELHMEMIKKEIYLLSQLKHPHVVNMQTNFYVHGDNHIYIVMEYAPNGNLMKFLKDRRIASKPLKETVIIAINLIIN